MQQEPLEKKAPSIHASHRTRMRDRAKAQGFDGFADHEFLEMLLYHALPRKDTNILAHRLISRFGCYHRVFEATMEELMAIEGVGEPTALFIRMLGAHEKRSALDRRDFAMKNVSLDTTAHMKKYLLPQFRGARDEIVMLVCVDSRCRAVSCEMLSSGTVDQTEVSCRKIIQIALRNHAAGVILAHNHPRGAASPSCDDIHTTEVLQAKLLDLDIRLHEHMIIADEECTPIIAGGFCSPLPIHRP